MKDRIKKILRNRDYQLISYKILHDILFCLLVSMVLSLFAEAILPGMVSQNNGFLAISFMLFVNVLLVAWLGKKLSITYEDSFRSKAMPFIIFLAFILIGNSLLKFSLWENLVITTVTIIIIALFYQILFSDKE